MTRCHSAYRRVHASERLAEVERMTTKFLLTEDELPSHWYNILADVPEPLGAFLSPQTLQPLTPPPSGRAASGTPGLEGRRSRTHPVSYPPILSCTLLTAGLPLCAGEELWFMLELYIFKIFETVM